MDAAGKVEIISVSDVGTEMRKRMDVERGRERERKEEEGGAGLPFIHQVGDG